MILKFRGGRDVAPNQWLVFVVAAELARAASVKAAAVLISRLHPADFETLVDMIFSRTGWQRISRLGGNMADVDLILREPVTNEIAAVQVKSQATQATLDDYRARFDDARVFSRVFFICHSPRGAIERSNHEKIHIWVGESLAEMAIRAGLYDWLIEKTL